MGGSQKAPVPVTVPVPSRPSTDFPLLGPQSDGAVTPLDTSRLQSRAVRSALRRVKGGLEVTKGADTGTPLGQEKEKTRTFQMDTPSRFLSRDKLFKPNFDTKVS